MTTIQDVQAMSGRTAVDTEGSKIGKIGQVYVDDRTGQPLWVTISTGMFGTKESFAPLHGSRDHGDALQMAVTKDMVKGAPGVDADGHVGEAESDSLYDYYAEYLGGSSHLIGTDDVMTGSAEMPVGTEQTETGRARLRKHVMTENVTRTVPFSHDKPVDGPGSTTTRDADL